MQSLKIHWRGKATSAAHIFSMETETPSWPCDLLGLKLFIILIICSWDTERWDNDASVLEIKLGKTLPLSLIVH